MTKKVRGMKNPINKGRLQRVFGVLVVLLIASALLIGAASAEGTVLVFADEFDNDHPTTYAIITEAGNYVLSNDATGNIVIRVKENEDVTLTAENNAKLTGLISIESASTVTITGMSFVLNDNTNSSAFQGKYNDHSTEVPAVSLRYGGTCSTIIMTENTFDFTEVTSGTSGKNANMFKSHGPALADGSVFHGNTVINATGHVLNLVGIENGSTLTVEQNTVTMNPYKTDRALLKTYDQKDSVAVNYRAEVVNLNYVVKGNSLTITDGNTQTGTTLVAFDEAADTGYNTVTVVLQGNTLGAGVTFENGQTKPDKFGSFIIKDNAGNVILVKDQNQTGVIWNTDNVTLSKGNYVSTTTGTVVGINSENGVIVDSIDLAKKELGIKGNLSMELGSSGTQNFGELTAVTEISTNVTREVTWEVTKNDGVITVGTSSNNGKFTYTPATVGNATVEVKTAGGIKETIVITVFNVTKPTEVTTGVATSTSGVADAVNFTTTTTAITVPSEVQSGTKTQNATIKAGDVTIELTYEGDGAVYTNDGSTTSLDGKIETMVAEYPVIEAPASPEVAAPAKVILNITLDANAVLNSGSIQLPEISPEFNETVNSTVVDVPDTDYKPLSMITATHAELGKINANISTDGIELTFIIPMGAVEESKIKALHVDGNNVNPAAFTVSNDGTNYIVVVKGSKFSSYVLVEDNTVQQKDTNTQSSSSSSSGSSVWLQESVTPTEQPTPNETATPTDTVPTDIPVTQPTSEPSSPGFGILAALAGLGAVAVLRRK